MAPRPGSESAGRFRPGASVPRLCAILATHTSAHLKATCCWRCQVSPSLFVSAMWGFSASAFLMEPLLEFLLTLFLFADAMQLHDKWQFLCWSMMDLLCCVTVAFIYFTISITAVTKCSHGTSKSAKVLDSFAIFVFTVDLCLIFNNLAIFLKQWSPQMRP